MSKLNIYRCSAGSGKTFKITEEYLNLLFQNTDNYRHILAVTFTNKATEEMKTRILKEINLLANSDDSSYTNTIADKFNINPLQIKQKAKILLSNILHDYSRFSVETIESFFQKIIRSFTKEIGIYSAYELEFSTDKVLNKVIDLLFIDIDTNENLKNWLINFSETKVQEGKNWDLKNDIYKLSKEIFKEEFQLFSENNKSKFDDKNLLSDYYKELQKVITDFETHLETIGNKALKLIESYSIEYTDFSYGKNGFANYFYKIANYSNFPLSERVDKCFNPLVRPRECYNNPAKWFSKNSEYKENIIGCYNNGLNDLLGEAIDYFDDNVLNYSSAIEIYKHVLSLGILIDVSKKINQYCSDNNIMLIPNSTKILSEIISDSDAPFIYEKTGFFYRHFMIDEFQDTSALQWKNFKPLIDTSLSENHTSMIVGDVKQSIYRWRNGNWKLLADEVNKQYEHYGVNDLSLKHNWRSKKNIISFNNSLFTIAAKQLQDFFNANINEKSQSDEEIIKLKSKILEAYKDIYQSIHSSKKHVADGYVKLSFVKDTDDKKWDEIVIDNLPALLNDVQDREYSLKDIAIIVRDNKDGKNIADFLLNYKINNQSDKYKYDVISIDSLIIGNSLHIQFIIHLLMYFSKPDDAINKAFVLNHYKTYINKAENSSNNEFHTYFNSVLKDNESINDIFIENNSDFEQLKSLSLYELVEELIRIFKLNTDKNEIAYLQSLQDMVLDFINSNCDDINSFIEWYNEEGIKKPVSVANKQDAITITTIHKSKGLEFKVVIIPYCNWDIDTHPFNAGYLWCKPTVSPFNNLELVPVKYSSILADTIFYKEYYSEKIQNYIDNLNLLYVASTRAEDELYIFSPSTENSKTAKSIANFVHNVIELPDENPKTNDVNEFYIDFSKHWDREKDTLEIGKLVKAEKEKENKKEKAVEIIYDVYPTYKKNQQVLLKNYSIDYFSDAEHKINSGKLMHEIFENIITINDIDKATNKLYFEGKITKEERAKLNNEVKELVNNDKVKDWFSDKWKVLTESEILLKDGKTKRPDRVLISNDCAIVIDYKFGEEEDNNHNRQVKDYVDCLLQMNYKSVKGFLWYAHLNKVVEVN